MPFHLIGSNACEIFFSKVGGMVGMERAYDLNELMSSVNALNHLSTIEYGENGLHFGRTHNKQCNIWAKLHLLKDGKVCADLCDYSGVRTDDEIV